MKKYDEQEIIAGLRAYADDMKARVAKAEGAIEALTGGQKATPKRKPRASKPKPTPRRKSPRSRKGVATFPKQQ